MPQVSIIIPCYNQSHYLRQAVASCLEQTFADIEVIVVDDGSEDDLTAALSDIEDQRLSLIRQANAGPSAARNAGLSASSGSYVKFLDADDWLLPECIAAQVGSLQVPGFDLSVVGYRFQYEHLDHAYDVSPLRAPLREALLSWNIGPPVCMMFSREALEHVGGFDAQGPGDRGHEDYDLVCRLALAGFRCVFLDVQHCVYRYTEQGISADDQRMQRTRVSVWRTYCDKILADKPSDGLLAQLLGGLALRIVNQDIDNQEVAEWLARIAGIMASRPALCEPQAKESLAQLRKVIQAVERPRMPESFAEGVVAIVRALLMRIPQQHLWPADTVVGLAKLVRGQNRKTLAWQLLTVASETRRLSAAQANRIRLFRALFTFAPGPLARRIMSNPRSAT